MIREGRKMAGIDIGALRRKLVVMGYSLHEINGGFVIRSMFFDTLVAGSEAEPLTLEMVAAFAA